MVSQKQLEANQKNAQKGGVKTPEGKAIVKYNALKHGLLAQEVVITVGEGAENPEPFNALLGDLKTQLAPEGTLEEILVEKIAVAYWRLRRAYKYEVGLIRNELDDATEKFYNNTTWDGKKLNKTNEEIEQEMKQEKEHLQEWEKDKRNLSRLYKAKKPLEDIFDWEDNWGWLEEKASYHLSQYEEYTDDLEPKKIRELLNRADWSDERIWETLIEICDERIKHHEEQITALMTDKRKNQLKLQVIRKLGNIPSKYELDRLLRYEGAIERQLYKAMNQLERLQRLRSGDNVPAPVEVDVNTGQNG